METKKSFEHLLHFYRSEEDLLSSLVKYITTGFANDDSCIIISTAMHRKMLEDQLEELGIDSRLMETIGKYQRLDADTTLSHFMVDGMPDLAKFNQVIGSMIPYTAHRPIRAYSEMVSLLWAQGNKKGALALEDLWNGLGAVRNFTLFCAYPEVKIKDDERVYVKTFHNFNNQTFA